MSYQDVQAPLQIAYNEAQDVLTIDGVPYAGLFFRALALAQPGTWLRIEERQPSGQVSVRTVPESVERTFDAISGCGRR